MKINRKLTIIFGSIIFLLFGCNKSEDVHDHDHSLETVNELNDKDIEKLQEMERELLAKLDFGKCKEVEFKKDSFVQICNYEKELQSIEEVKSIFPNIQDLNPLNSYLIEKIYISIDETTAKEIEKVRSWTEFNKFTIDLTKDQKDYIHLGFIQNEYSLEKTDKINEVKYNENIYKILNPKDSYYEAIFTQRNINNKNIFILASNYNADSNNSYIEENEFISIIDKYIQNVIK